MNTCISSILLALIFFSCQKDMTGTNNSYDEISFSTDKFSYSELDTININLKNNSSPDILIGLRCGVYLEMFYQKKENELWIDNLWLWYMSLRCLTLADSIETNKKFTQSIPAERFVSKGTFRLLVDVYFLGEDSSATIISNTFTIK